MQIKGSLGGKQVSAIEQLIGEKVGQCGSEDQHQLQIDYLISHGLLPGWWFQIFFIFTPTWGRFPF